MRGYKVHRDRLVALFRIGVDQVAQQTLYGRVAAGRDRAIPGSLDAHPADAGRRAALQIALACVLFARSIPNAGKGGGLAWSS